MVRVIGIFTELDYARKVGPERRNPEKNRVEEVMKTKLIIIGLNQTVNEGMVLIADHHIRHLPVIEQFTK